MVSPTSLPTSLHISPTQCTCLTSVSHQEYAIKDYHDTTGTKLRGFSAPFATGTSGMSAPGEGVANVNSSDTMNNGHQNAKTTWWWHQNMVLTQHNCLVVTKSGDIDGQREWVPANAAAAKCPENPTAVGTNPIVGTGLCDRSWDQYSGWDGFI